ncbi:hypothetical protein LUU34_00626300 [Aix galericulata]|nr:hypothetical protein LUU34_00626300 [Aix galericulata]
MISLKKQEVWKQLKMNCADKLHLHHHHVEEDPRHLHHHLPIAQAPLLPLLGAEGRHLRLPRELQQQHLHPHLHLDQVQRCPHLLPTGCILHHHQCIHHLRHPGLLHRRHHRVGRLLPRHHHLLHLLPVLHRHLAFLQRSITRFQFLQETKQRS